MYNLFRWWVAYIRYGKIWKLFLILTPVAALWLRWTDTLITIKQPDYAMWCREMFKRRMKSGTHFQKEVEPEENLNKCWKGIKAEWMGQLRSGCQHSRNMCPPDSGLYRNKIASIVLKSPGKPFKPRQPLPPCPELTTISNLAFIIPMFLFIFIICDFHLETIYIFFLIYLNSVRNMW